VRRIIISTLLLIYLSTAAHAQPKALPAVLQETIAYYASLSSYADTGTVTQEGSGMIDTARFVTYFRRPTRDLYFDYQPLTLSYAKLKITSDLSANRTVAWMEKGNLQLFDFKLKLLTNAGATNQTGALQGATYNTHGTSILIPSLLYSQSRLPSSILQLEEVTTTAMENIDGCRCHKLAGTAAAYYPSGRRTSVRSVTVWIDADTKLVRRVFEDVPGEKESVSRTTIKFDPRANPPIDDAKFRFTPPAK